MLFSAKISELQSQLTAALGQVTLLTSERDTLTASLSEHATANKALEERYTLDQTAIGTLTSERDTAVKTVAELTTKVELLEKNVSAKVREQIASAGVPAIERVDNPGDVKPDAQGPRRTQTTWGRDFSAK